MFFTLHNCFLARQQNMREYDKKKTLTKMKKVSSRITKKKKKK